MSESLSLHDAAKSGDVAVVAELAKPGVDLNAKQVRFADTWHASVTECGARWCFPCHGVPVCKVIVAYGVRGGSCVCGKALVPYGWRVRGVCAMVGRFMSSLSWGYDSHPDVVTRTW